MHLVGGPKTEEGTLMRVLHVVRQFHPGVGGIEAFVLCLARQQRRQGVSADVLTLDRLFTKPQAKLAAHDCVGGVPVRRIGYVGSSRYPIALAVLFELEPYDLVHVHGVDFFCDFLAVTRWLHAKPLVLSTHGGFFHTSFARRLKLAYFRTITRFSLRQYRRVLVCSVNDAQTFSAIARHPVIRIDNGVDVEKFAAAASPSFRPELIYFGRFAANKGLPRLIAAFDSLAAVLPDARLHLMGRDWDDLLPQIEAQIGNTRHRHAIQIHHDPTDDDIRSVIGRCSFFVSASHYEGFGLTLVESMAAGLLPMVSPIPSFASILEGSDAGALVDFDEPATAGHRMAEFITTAAADHARLRELAIMRAATYAWPQVAHRFVDVYEEILGTRERELLGVRLSTLTARQARAVIDREFAAERRLNVGFANAHTLNVARADPRFRTALGRQLVLNDGIGVDLASRIKFGRPFRANLNGTDFVPEFLAHSRHRLRLYLIGSTDDVIAKAASRLRSRFPRHDVVGWRNGFFRDDADCEAACRAICASGANCVLVGMGNPRQELWIDRWGGQTGATLHLGVGALFDFEAERVKRAPAWIRRMRCEWLFRLAHEPRRLAQRYLVGNFLFLYRAIQDARR